MSYPASDPQIRFITTLVTERKNQFHVTDVAAFVQALKDQRMTKQGASILIDTLTAVGPDPKPVVAGAAPVPANVRPNRFAGKCILCGKEVAAGAGALGGRAGAWTTSHLPGQCPVEEMVLSTMPTLDEIVAGNLKDARAWAVVNELIATMEKGGYAVPSITGTNDLTFFKIYVNQGRTNPANKGKKGFDHVVGGHEDGELRVGPSFVIKAIRAAEAVGFEAAQRKYAVEFTCCARCGKSLTVEESRNQGYGPECIKKVSW